MLFLLFLFLLRLELHVGPGGRVDPVNDLGVADHGVPDREPSLANGTLVSLELQVDAGHVLLPGRPCSEHCVAVVALQVLDLVVDDLDVKEHRRPEVELPVADLALVIPLPLKF